MNWDTIVEDLGPRLYRYFCARFSDFIADDLTQETLIRLVRKCQDQEFDPERGNLSMYAFGIAHFVALEAKKERSEQSLSELEEDGLEFPSETDFENDLANYEYLSHVKKYFTKLKPIEQQILALSIDDEMTNPQIAELISIPEGTIKSHIFRAKKQLFEWIKAEVSI